MKKRYIALYLLMVFVLSACGVDRTKDVVGVSDALGGTEAESITEEFSVSETMMDDEDSEELQIMEVNKCVHFLHKNGKALVDADKDGLADTFRIDYVDREGGLYIEEFEFALGGGGSFRILESELPYTFNGHIEYIDSFDFNEDGKEELLVMFDTHGAGGQDRYYLSDTEGKTWR
ncbi:MAG: hypothetical protein IJ335_07830 [Lachnospiraceae bacterium]|nr:hypothetical protein [Lachnospiraceae bacterium]